MIDFIRGKFTQIAIILFIALIAYAAILTMRNKALKTDNERLASNQENLIQNPESSYTELTITRSEYKKAEAAWKKNYDSLFNAHGLTLKQVRRAESIIQRYRSDSIIHANTGKPVLQDTSVYKAPVWHIPVISPDSLCWGMKGVIISEDPNSQLDITSRTFNNSASVVWTRKLFLGFLWEVKRKRKVEVSNECGEIKIVDITFK